MQVASRLACHSPQFNPVLEEHERHRLQRRDVDVESGFLLPLSEGSLDDCCSLAVTPRELTTHVDLGVKFVKAVNGLLHLTGQSHFIILLVGWPISAGEHLDVEVNSWNFRSIRSSLLKELLVLFRRVVALLVTRLCQIVHHALHVLCECRSALHFEFADHRLLSVVGGRFGVEEPFRKLVLVDLLEEVLVGKVGEDSHDIGEKYVDLRRGEAR